MMPPFQLANPGVRESMRVISITERTPHMPISAGPWIDPECRDRMTTALLAMPSTPVGLEALGKAAFKGFVQSLPDMYDSLKWAAEQIDSE
jgi:ABC-type phosphate/phosphonate transport system substrate-binding protein